MQRQFRQTSEHERLTGGEGRPVAVLKLEPSELAARFGIQFTESQDLDDGAGPFRCAGLDLASGTRVLLICYQYAGGGTQLEVALGSDSRGILQEFLEATQLKSAEVQWHVPLGTAN